uniref:Meiosis-specific, MEI4 homolog (S. cerevisiae) n=1 Tax=Anabas testudineus TaxID=64144 RepID=A0A3Q1HDN7_ANATE
MVYLPGESFRSGEVEWVFMRAKVALAVAIIKNKPQGVSGREYAEALSCELRSRHEGWKEKAQELQQEVLRLQQEVRRLQQEVLRLQQEVPRLQQEATALQPDSDSETPDLMLEDNQPCTVVSPHPAAPFTFHVHAQGDAMHSHVQFLQSFCALHRVEGNNKDLEVLWFSSGGDAGSVLVDSVCQLLDSVVTACRDPPPLGPHDLVPQACQVAAQAMDLFCSQRLPSAEFMGRVQESLRELTAMLLHSNQPSRVSNGIRSPNISVTFQGQESSVLDTFPLDQYQNSCYLFWILEELLRKSKTPCRVDVGSEQMGFLSHLEQHVFLLSDEFPLFSICMWRIGSLLTSSENKMPQSASDQTGPV